MEIYVIGAGNWGTTLAQLFSYKNKVHLWTIDKAEAELINENNENVHFLPGIKLSENIIVEEKYSQEPQKDDVIILAVPSRKMDELSREMAEKGINNHIIVNVSKVFDIQLWKQ